MIPVLVSCFDLGKTYILTLLKNISLIQEDIFAPQAVIDTSRCKFCGECSLFCPEKAIQFSRYIPSVTLIVSRCSTCGNCIRRCQRNAIRTREKIVGTLHYGHTDNQYFVVGELNENSENKTPLIKALLEKTDTDGTIICDFGPGDGADVRVGLSNMDMAAIIVTPESHWKKNLEAMFALVKKHTNYAGVLLNKVENDEGFIKQVQVLCDDFAIPFIGIVSYNEKYQLTHSLNHQQTNTNQDSIFSEILNKMVFLVNKTFRAEYK